MLKFFAQKPRRKRPLGRCRHGKENNIKMDLKTVGCEDHDWIYLAQDRIQWCVCEQVLSLHLL
jgi:hypothetical protein